jgi:N-acetylglutamate synthase-like GNAT family acetyltransferase
VILGKDMRAWSVKSKAYDEYGTNTWDLCISEENHEVGRCRITLKKDHINIDEIVVKKANSHKDIVNFLIHELGEYARAVGMSEIRGLLSADGRGS